MEGGLNSVPKGFCGSARKAIFSLTYQHQSQQKSDEGGVFIRLGGLSKGGRTRVEGINGKKAAGEANRRGGGGDGFSDHDLVEYLLSS